MYRFKKKNCFNISRILYQENETCIFAINIVNVVKYAEIAVTNSNSRILNIEGHSNTYLLVAV